MQALRIQFSSLLTSMTSLKLKVKLHLLLILLSKLVVATLPEGVVITVTEETEVVVLAHTVVVVFTSSSPAPLQAQDPPVRSVIVWVTLLLTATIALIKLSKLPTTFTMRYLP